ncbi:MAG: efflux RND transporter periplasmic adaptor subunit, partial [Burkholderiaceae bacterium]|nr:efflux RND transporter periplasmic adaptor subunit [Burkholderiaceae bacterium]
LSHAGIPAIKLPTSALRQEGQSTAVWVYDAASSTVKSQVVQIATADGNEAVVAAGLTPGMQVVATGVHVLSPGQKVLIYQQKTASAPASKAQTATNSVAMPAVPAASAAPAATAAAPAASTAN